jgi:hypothetical protein
LGAAEAWGKPKAAVVGGPEARCKPKAVVGGDKPTAPTASVLGATEAGGKPMAVVVGEPEAGGKPKVFRIKIPGAFRASHAHVPTAYIASGKRSADLDHSQAAGAMASGEKRFKSGSSCEGVTLGALKTDVVKASATVVSTLKRPLVEEGPTEQRSQSKRPHHVRMASVATYEVIYISDDSDSDDGRLKAEAQRLGGRSSCDEPAAKKVQKVMPSHEASVAAACANKENRGGNRGGETVGLAAPVGDDSDDAVVCRQHHQQ